MSDTPDLSDALFAQIASALHTKTGISLKEYKKYLVISRLGSLVGVGKRFESFEGLYQTLKTETNGELSQVFINALTTNFSYFFRDSAHFDVLAKYLREVAPGQPYLRLWSAASSTGEEAYSMAMTVARHTGPLPSDLRILATDISTKVLGIADRGTYTTEALGRHVSESDRRRFFMTCEDPGRYQVRDELRQAVDFRQINLHNPFPFRKQFDVIFLRNVMIYFAQKEKAELIRSMEQVLKPGGLLLIGLSESLAGIPHGLETYRNSVYRKGYR